MSRLPPSPPPLLPPPLIPRLKTLIVFNITTTERGGLGKGRRGRGGQQSYDTELVCVCVCVCVCEGERDHAKSELRGGRDGGGEIAYVLRVSAPVLSSLKPFNKGGGGGREGGRGEGLKEGAFGRIQIFTPSHPSLSLPRLLSPFLLLHTLTPSFHPLCPLISSPPFPLFSHPHPPPPLSYSSFIYPFPPQSPSAHPLDVCTRMCVCVCWMHISLTGWDYNGLNMKL